MSLKSWEEEFYPVPAEDCAEEDALDHSILKWDGAKPEALGKHGMVREGIILREKGNRGRYFLFSGNTCALCHFYLETTDCEQCPLFKVRGGDSCCVELPGEDMSPYSEFDQHDNPEPMIQLLAAAKEAEE